jgi:hypothetical protein
MKPRILIEVEGGLVASIESDVPCQVFILDRDNEQCGDEFFESHQVDVIPEHEMTKRLQDV